MKTTEKEKNKKNTQKKLKKDSAAYLRQREKDLSFLLLEKESFWIR